MEKEIVCNLSKETKQKVEEMLRVAYRRVGYRNEGEIELNIRGVFLDKWAMRKWTAVVMDGKEYENVMLLTIANDFGVNNYITMECECPYKKGHKEHVVFAHSHRQSLYLMVGDDIEPKYVLRDYDYYDDDDRFEYTHSANDIYRVVDIKYMNVENFKPKDYYVKVSEMSDELLMQFKRKIKDVVVYFDADNAQIADEYIDQCLESMKYASLQSLEIDGVGYKHAYAMWLGYYRPDYSDCCENNRTTRYGKEWTYDEWRALALLVYDDTVELAELVETSFTEGDGEMLMVDAMEFTEYSARILKDVNEIDTNRLLTNIDGFKLEKEKEAEEKRRKGELEKWKAEIRAKREERKK